MEVGLSKSRPVDSAGPGFNVSSMIDTHCHLTDERLGSQLDGVLTRAAAANVTSMITIGTGVEDSRQCVAVCRGRENVRCAVGVHPGYVDEEQFEELPALREMQNDPAVVAIGEIGLDYFRGKANRDRQIQFLQWQLQLATDVKKPVVIHSREAIDDCLAILRDFPAIRAVFHCFTGSADEAKKILDAGYLLGFTGVITFKNTQPLRDIVAFVPMDRLLIETDAPYLTPEPMRKQKVNEPAMVAHVGSKVAGIRGISVEQVDQITTQNAAALFCWPKS
jgi:TatD DNase family protein